MTTSNFRLSRKACSAAVLALTCAALAVPSCAEETAAPEAVAPEAANLEIAAPQIAQVNNSLNGVRLAQAMSDSVMVPRSEWEEMKRKQEDLERQVQELRSASGMPAVTTGAGTTREGVKPEGWYIGLSTGVQQRKDAADVQGAATVFEDGYLVSGALGYRKNGFRLEAESLTFNNVNKREIVTGAFDEPARGNISLQGYMFNAYYDFFANKKTRVKPYIGLGAGVFQSQVNGLTSATLLSGVPGFFGPTVVDTTSKFTTAYQLKAGVSYSISRRADMLFGYRYYAGNKFSITSPTLGILDVNGPRIHALEVGLRVGL